MTNPNLKQTLKEIATLEKSHFSLGAKILVRDGASISNTQAAQAVLSAMKQSAEILDNNGRNK